MTNESISSSRLSFLTFSAFGEVSSSGSFNMLLTSSGVKLSISASNSSYVFSFSTLSVDGTFSSGSFNMLLTSSGVKLSISASNSSYVFSFATVSVGGTFSSGSFNMLLTSLEFKLPLIASISL